MFTILNLNNLVLIIFTIILINTNNSTFSASSLPILEERCIKSNLSIDAAHGRNRWAYKCQNNFTDEQPLFIQLHKILKQRPRPHYPLVSDESKKDYNAPTSESRGCEKYTVFHGFCLSSCFTPDQNILFIDGYIQIKEATKERKTNVMALTKESTLSSFDLAPQSVEAYQQTRKDAIETVIVITTESGIVLKITEDHPILLNTGVMVKAKDLKVGQILIKESGEFDSIVALETKVYWGKVYNIAPASTHSKENIIVAQGILVGSANFQYHEMFKDLMYRKILREMIKLGSEQ